MAKYRDRSGMGRSQLIPYQPGESALYRHGRRLMTNLAHSGEVTAWCFERAVTVTISNHGHHWKFIYGHKLAEWWPSSAKLVFERTYHQGVHCHDYGQVMAALSKRWKLADRGQSVSQGVAG